MSKHLHVVLTRSIERRKQIVQDLKREKRESNEEKKPVKIDDVVIHRLRLIFTYCIDEVVAVQHTSNNYDSFDT